MVAPPRCLSHSGEPSLAAYSPPAPQHPGVIRNHPSSSVTKSGFSTSRALSPVLRSVDPFGVVWHLPAQGAQPPRKTSSPGRGPVLAICARGHQQTAALLVPGTDDFLRRLAWRGVLPSYAAFSTDGIGHARQR